MRQDDHPRSPGAGSALTNYGLINRFRRRGHSPTRPHLVRDARFSLRLDRVRGCRTPRWTLAPSLRRLIGAHSPRFVSPSQAVPASPTHGPPPTPIEHKGDQQVVKDHRTQHVEGQLRLPRGAHPQAPIPHTLPGLHDRVRTGSQPFRKPLDLRLRTTVDVSAQPRTASTATTTATTTGNLWPRSSTPTCQLRPG